MRTDVTRKSVCVCTRVQTDTHTLTHNQLVLPLLKHLVMNHSWLPAPTGAPQARLVSLGRGGQEGWLLQICPILFLLRCGKPKWPFISRPTSTPEFEVIKYCLWGCGTRNFLPNGVSTGSSACLDTHTAHPGLCRRRAQQLHLFLQSDLSINMAITATKGKGNQHLLLIFINKCKKKKWSHPAALTEGNK